MRRTSLFFGVGALALLAISSVISPQKRLIWNRTNSAPTGIYWVKNRVPELGDLVLISADSDDAIWAQTHGFVGDDWPLLKHVAGQSGDRVCRLNGEILINEIRIATMMEVTSRGTNLPVWTGCRVLSDDEIFLLNSHPKSLDGRYFGPTKIKDVDGVAVLLFEIRFF
jgi:conjugative transfer signal peptidase TraF